MKNLFIILFTLAIIIIFVLIISHFNRPLKEHFEDTLEVSDDTIEYKNFMKFKEIISKKIEKFKNSLTDEDLKKYNISREQIENYK